MAEKSVQNSQATVKTKDAEVDIYMNVAKFEEEQACNRDENKDSSIYFNTLHKWQDIMKWTNELKTKENPSKEKLEEYRNNAIHLFLILKKLNRLDKIRSKQKKDILNKKKQEIDSKHLQQENLLNELFYLKKEISKCLQYKSSDSDIDLIPVDVFCREANISVEDKEKIQNSTMNEHELHVKRLQWELEQRQTQQKQCEEVEKNKEIILAEIQEESRILQSILPMLKDIRTASLPLQQSFGLPPCQVKSYPDVVNLLPKPLYYLYIQADAFREASNKHFIVSTNGDEEEARRFETNKNQINEVNSDEEIDVPKPKKRHHKKSRTDSKSVQQRSVLAKHPLSVKLTLNLKNNTEFVVEFFYLANLNVITVVVTSSWSGFSSSYSRELLSPITILDSLFSGDDGAESPNIVNYHQLDQMTSEFNTLDVGKPYVWAQNICGLNFLNPNKPDYILSRNHVSRVLKAINNRLQTRLSLISQLDCGDLERRFGINGVNLTSVLSPWNTMTWDNYNKLPYCKPHVESESVSEQDLLFKRVVNYKTAALTVVMAIKCDYPSSTPVFALQLNMPTHNEGTSVLNSTNNNSIRELEREINVFNEQSEDDDVNELLINIIGRLVVCFEVMMETWGHADFPKTKTVLYNIRGRTRSHPFKAVKHHSGTLFEHRNSS
ncbi:THO complex subunit 5 homolog A isoform X2 [Adelges cooleyi]|uniref:THO complex subunit 5 homolog A isoform X2 n=1 Tax=Adelges cooleyi TaxID=133065 RepID=UPI0021806FEF|nr:THO complex subunit 5 homolog A isoform X2 [Adelges cooleyi]